MLCLDRKFGQTSNFGCQQITRKRDFWMLCIHFTSKRDVVLPIDPAVKLIGKPIAMIYRTLNRVVAVHREYALL